MGILSSPTTNFGIPQKSHRFVSHNIFTPQELNLPEPTKFLINIKYKNSQGEHLESGEIRFDYHPQIDSWTIGE